MPSARRRASACWPRPSGPSLCTRTARRWPTSQQALTVTADPAENAAIRERAAHAAELAGALELAIQHAGQAADVYRQLGDALSVLRTSAYRGHTLINFHLEDEATDALRSAIAEAEPLGEVPELGAAYAELARVRMLQNEYDESIAAADRALSLGAGLPSPYVVAEALVTKGTSLDQVGRSVESQAVLRGAIVVAERHGLVPTALRARNNLVGPTTYIDVGEAERLQP